MSKTGHAACVLQHSQAVDELRERLISVWCEQDLQSVVNHTIDEWRRRLLACVDAEHYL